MDSKEDQILSHEEQFARVKEICQDFYLTDEQLININQSLLSEMQKGLKPTANKEQSSIKCWPTFIQEHPCGCEHGIYLVLEITTHNFHISFINLKGAHNYHYEKETHEIPTQLYAENAEGFFDFVVGKLNKFVRHYKLEQELLSMVLCFPFSLRHTSLKNAVVQSSGENLVVQMLQEKEVGKLLEDAIARSEDLGISVEAVVSNCTAILLANSWQDQCCHIGINIEHDFNAVYVERVSEIEMYSVRTSASNLLISTQWSDFGANGHLDYILTPHDQLVDEQTKNKGQRKFEKLVSSVYLAELARQVFLHCINEKVLFEGFISQYLKRPFSFTISYVSSMLEEEESEKFARMRLQFDKMGISMPDENECSKVHYILNSIVQRSAQLLAVGIICLSERIEGNRIVVAIGESFYSNCSIYKRFLAQNLRKLLNSKSAFELRSLANDVAIGSALSAAISRNKEFIYHSQELSRLLEEVASINKQ